MNERLERFEIAHAKTAEALSVDVVVRAGGDGGPTLLCLPGFGDNLHTWQGLRDAFGPSRARVVAVDMPGLGRSPLPADFARPYLLNAVALLHAMCARWRAPGRPFFLVGNSLGGAIALAYAAREVDGEAPCDGMVLLAPATMETRVPIFAHLLRSPFYRWSSQAQRRLSRRGRRALAIVLARASMKLVLSDGAQPPRAWRDSIVASLSRPGSVENIEALARDVLWNLRGKDPEVRALWARLPRISTPLVLVHGTEDRVISAAEMAHLRDLVPGTRLVELAGIGHCPQIEAPDACAAAILELSARAR